MKNGRVFLLAWVVCAGILTNDNLTSVYAQPAQKQEIPTSPDNFKGSRDILDKNQRKVPVSAVEDLMREHGVLRRLMLVYEDLIRAFQEGADLPIQPLEDSTRLIRAFIQDYHERLEEKYLFAQLREAGRLADLTDTLQTQHAAGRKVIDIILKQASMPDRDKYRLIALMESFIKMYRPHAGREDTVLFPDFKSVISPRDYSRLGEQFEQEEQKLFGEKGFENIVAKVEEIEKALGTYDLNQFTPDSGGDGAGFASAFSR